MLVSPVLYQDGPTSVTSGFLCSADEQGVLTQGVLCFLTRVLLEQTSARLWVRARSWMTLALLSSRPGCSRAGTRPGEDEHLQECDVAPALRSSAAHSS